MVGVEGLKNLINKPKGTEEQFKVAYVVREIIDNSGKVLLIVGPISLLFFPKASVGVNIICGGIVGLFVLKEGFISRRIEDLEKAKKK